MRKKNHAESYLFFSVDFIVLIFSFIAPALMIFDKVSAVHWKKDTHTQRICASRVLLFISHFIPFYLLNFCATVSIIKINIHNNNINSGSKPSHKTTPKTHENVYDSVRENHVMTVCTYICIPMKTPILIIVMYTMLFRTKLRNENKNIGKWMMSGVRTQSKHIDVWSLQQLATFY